MPPPFKEWWRDIKCYPCLCVRSSVRYQNLVSSQVKFDLGYNLLIFDGVMGLL